LRFSLHTDYPFYFSIFCLGLGALAAWLTYSKNKFSRGDKWYGWPVWLLALLRFISVSLIAYLLLGPVVKSIFKKVEKPVVVIAMDNSSSIILNKDSSWYRKELPGRVQKLSDALSDSFDVRTYTFGSEI
jgi:hypothetical protein